jgi:Ca-activated chloride channel homolog
MAPQDHGLMATLAWTAPSALWILAAIPLIWIAQRAARTTFNPRQRVLQAAVRSLLVASLALALARPVASLRSTRESVVYAVDVSQSIGTAAIERAAQRIDELDAAVRPEHSRIVAFGASARTLDTTAALRALAHADPTARDAAGPDRSATDLEAGLDAARSELAPGHVQRVVLFSDGRATMGEVADAAARLGAAHVPVSTEPAAVRTLNDTWIEAIDLPPRLSAGASLPVAVTIGSQRAADAVVEVKSGGTVLATQRASLGVGRTRVTLDTQLDAAGGATLEASVSVPGDPLSANDTLRRNVWVGPRVRVLYIEGTPASARYLTSGLAASGFDVAVRPVSALPVTTAGYEPYDVTILSDVSRGAIAPAAITALTGWVERGGGLLVAGGDAVFGEGAGGYRNTALERLTPVTFERRDEPSVALILVLDRSWSMAGTSIDLCKSAAAAALDIMTAEQSLGVLTFNDKFDWEFTLRNVGKNREFMRQKIAAIEPSGRTLIFPALEQAYLALRTVKARAKHVILLSDGRTYPDDYEGLVKKMTDARITVSSIAVGPSADAELLRDIAKWGNGRQYAVADAHELPQIFVKEAKTAASPSFDEKTIKPIVKRAAFLQDVDLAHLPPLRGLTQTVMKDGALEVIATSDDDPLLAFWPVGLGRAAVFASDVKDRWGSEWVKWRGYGPFFAALVHALERQQAPPVALDVQAGAIRGGDRGVTIAVEARDADGGYRNLLRPMVHVTSGNGPARDVQARQVAPGRYEAALIASASQPLAVSLSGEPAPAPSRTVIADPAAELRWRAPDEALLKAIAVATGGVWQPSPDALRAHPDERSTERRPLWPPLVVLALALWLIDLVFRRVRVFE